MEDKLYYCCCLVVLLWDIITPTFGRICPATYHNLISNQQTYKILDRRNFKRNDNKTGNFLPIILDSQSNQLIIGAKDYIYFVNDTTLEETGSFYWRSDSQRISTCQSIKSTPRDYCANYIHFLAIHNRKLFACGTNSLVPKYKIIQLVGNNLSTSHKEIKEKVAFGVCSLRPDYAMVGAITDLGELISGSYKDYNKWNNPVISGTSVFDDQPKQKVTDKREKNEYMNQPEFITSVSVEDSVYIFIMEKAIELGNVKTGTVVRLCKGDNGGSLLMGENMWTTFRKSRLECIVKRNNDEYHFSNLVDVIYNENEDLFYASYTMFSDLNMYSAVCSFSRSDVDKAFSRKFIETGDTKDTNYLKPVENGNFLVGCNVNPTSLFTNKTSNTITGKQPTNYLSNKALTKAKFYNLMEGKVKSRPDLFEFMSTSNSFTQLALFPLKLKGSGSYPILYIGTQSGSILKVYKNKRFNKPCIIKEISTDVGKIQRLLMNEKKRILYVSSDKKVISLNLDYCHMHLTEDECKQTHDPTCGWSVSKKKCVHASLDNNTLQDLTKCPTKFNFLTQWSGWNACEYSSKKYCRCRTRSCSACNTSLCNNAPLMEILNCSSNSVDDVILWQKEGPKDGNWSEWQQWSTCSSSECGRDTISRIRICSSPPPSNGGKQCEGDRLECKVCPKNPPMINTIWGGWGNWGACIKVKGSYIMNRTRTCSKPNACPGSYLKELPCTPKDKGIEWAEWSNCSCTQRVRHRLPKLINGCENCSLLVYPQYGVCDCPTTETVSTKEVTPVPTEAKKLCTPVPTTKLPSTTNDVTIAATTISRITHTIVSSIKTQPDLPDIPTVIADSAAPQTDPRGCNPKNQFTLKSLIVIITIVIVTCFLLFGLIIYLIIRREQNKKVMVNGKSHPSDLTPLRKINPET